MIHNVSPRNAHGWFAALALFFACLLDATAASARDKITWAIYDVPPSYIVRGTPTPDTLGDGISDRLLGLLIKALPEYDHEIVLMTMPRALTEMRAGSQVCLVNAVRTPERVRVAYSTPLLITPAPQLVLSARLLDQHPTWQRGVSLATMIANPNLNGQYIAGRSFGDKLDAIVQSPANIAMKPNSGATASNALKMVALGRADYTIEYPQLLTYLAKTNEVPADLTTVPLLDANPFLEGHVLCARTAWGLAATRRIDGALQQLAATPAYRLALERWLPKDELRRHQGDYDRYYATRASKRFCHADCP